jgi:hypothetical protein
MGGILGAEVVLLPSVYAPGARRHPRILGMIAFDTPFLGMHPGIVSSGIASIFRPASPPTPASSADTPPEELDPIFAQRPARNFTITPSKKPGNPWESTLHFIAKHHENLMQATGTYLMSHLEFAACLADPIGLKTRYTQIRGLDDGLPMPDGGVDRVRFANYYTISYGRDKATVVNPPPPVPTEEDMVGPSRNQGHNFDVESGLEASVAQLAIVGAGLPVKAHSPTPSAASSMQSMQELEPEPMSPLSQVSSAPKDPPPLHLDVANPSVEVDPRTPIAPNVDDVEALFPPVSAPPAEPILQAIPENVEKQHRKALEKENKRLHAEYERQLKEHAKLVKAREKAIAKEREKVTKEREKERKQKEKEDKEKERLEEQERRRQQGEEEKQERQLEMELQKEKEKAEKKNKPPRQRKFCIIPSQQDATWTPVEMKGVDEVGAHCGLFFVGEVYAKLVGDVADRIEGWVDDERTRKLVEQTRDWEGGNGYPAEKRTR